MAGRYVTRMVFVRHGQSLCNLEGRLQGQFDSPLSRLGMLQAEACAEYLAKMHFDAAYSSDLSRAYVTACTIAGKHAGLDVVRDEALREIYFGKWQYMRPEEISQKYPADYALWNKGDPDTHCTGGESMAEVALRARSAAWNMARAHAGGSVLVVTHGGVLRTLMCEWLDIPYEKLDRARAAKNTGVYVVDYDTRSMKISPVVMGETGFLDDIPVDAANDRY